MSEAVEIVGKLLDCYPNRSQAGRAYIGALASVLVGYPAQVARQCPDPRLGVPAEKTFGLPTVADLVAWCERETESLRGFVDREDHFDGLARAQEQRAKDEAKLIDQRKQRPTYDDLKAKYGENWGVTNPDERKRWQPPSIEEICREAGVSRADFERTHADVVEKRGQIYPGSQPQREAAE